MERVEIMETCKSIMEQTVRGILSTAHYIWKMVGDLDEVVNLVHSAKMVCIWNDLDLDEVHQFENCVVDDWKRYKAREAEEELRKRFSDGFKEGI